MNIKRPKPVTIKNAPTSNRKKVTPPAILLIKLVKEVRSNKTSSFFVTFKHISVIAKAMKSKPTTKSKKDNQSRVVYGCSAIPCATGKNRDIYTNKCPRRSSCLKRKIDCRPC